MGRRLADPVRQTSREDSTAVMKIQGKLPEGGVAHRKLPGAKQSRGELAQRDGAYGKLADREEAAGALSDRDYAFGRDGPAVSIEKRDVQKRETENRQRRFVLESALSGWRVFVEERVHKK